MKSCNKHTRSRAGSEAGPTGRLNFLSLIRIDPEFVCQSFPRLPSGGSCKSGVGGHRKVSNEKSVPTGCGKSQENGWLRTAEVRERGSRQTNCPTRPEKLEKKNAHEHARRRLKFCASFLPGVCVSCGGGWWVEKVLLGLDNNTIKKGKDGTRGWLASCKLASAHGPPPGDQEKREDDKLKQASRKYVSQ